MKMTALLIASLALVASAAKADPKADKLFKEAKHHEEVAGKEREIAAHEMHKAHELLIRANRNDIEAHVEISRAFGILKADKNTIAAHQKRHEAHLLAHRAHEHMLRAQMDKRNAAEQTHYAKELTAAAGKLPDQPEIAASLNADARRHTDAAARDLAAATKQEAEAKADHDKAKALWAEAKALDPKTAVAAAPAVAPAAPAAAAPAPLAAVQAVAK